MPRGGSWETTWSIFSRVNLYCRMAVQFYQGRLVKDRGLAHVEYNAQPLEGIIGRVDNAMEFCLPEYSIHLKKLIFSYRDFVPHPPFLILGKLSQFRDCLVLPEFYLTQWDLLSFFKTPGNLHKKHTEKRWRVDHLDPYGSYCAIECNHGWFPPSLNFSPVP